MTEPIQSQKQAIYDDAEFPVQEAYPLMDEVARKVGWDDPAMDVYSDLSPQQPQ